MGTKQLEVLKYDIYKDPMINRNVINALKNSGAWIEPLHLSGSFNVHECKMRLCGIIQYNRVRWVESEPITI